MNYLPWARRNRFAINPVSAGDYYQISPSSIVWLDAFGLVTQTVTSAVVSETPVNRNESPETTLDMPSMTITSAMFHLYGTATVTIAAPAVVSAASHGFSDGQIVQLSTTSALPTGLTAGAWYYVVNKTADDFQLALTLGGGAIGTTGSQSGAHSLLYKV